jgi:hypothetical protein
LDGKQPAPIGATIFFLRHGSLSVL